MLFYLLFFPLVTKRIVKKKGKKLADADVKSSVGTLYITQDTHKLKSCQEYITWFMYRRFIFALTIVLFDFKMPVV